jgi:hypothetical protein
VTTQIKWHVAKALSAAIINLAAILMSTTSLNTQAVNDALWIVLSQTTENMER